ncbi:MAG: Maf family protein [Aestuariivirga sp.]
MPFNTQSLILASTSMARQTMMKSAGLVFEVKKPAVDEKALQEQFAHLTPSELAMQLARAKARSIHADEAYVIGSDQTLEFETCVFHKARNLSEAISNLRRLSGHTHKLHSAVVVVKNGAVQFSHTATAIMTMRLLDEAFLQSYAEREQEALLNSVGGYYYEAAGRKLFEDVTGDINIIMGMPLLPLLAFLRKKAIVTS